MTNCTIYENHAESYGGGISIFGPAEIKNCTITNNEANILQYGLTGGGIFIDASAFLQIGNTIISANIDHNSTGQDVSGTITSLGGNLIGIGEGSTGFTGTNDQVGTTASPIDAKLGPLQDNGGPTLTCMPLDDSPAINAGLNTLITNPPFDGPPFYDQRGPDFVRIYADIVDIGAVEVQPSVEGEVEGAEGEGIIEGEGEGVPAEGEGIIEGEGEGVPTEGEGIIEGEGEGIIEGEGEGTPAEGEGEGMPSEGSPEEGEGEGVPSEGEGEGIVEGEGVPNEGEGEGNIEGEGTPAEGEGIVEGSPQEGEGQTEHHTADQDGDGQISLSELLRVIQFFNSGGFHCQSGTEDGYTPGSGGDTTCTAHNSDYAHHDWAIGLSELLRLIQFFNSGGYYPCTGSEDGFCPGPYSFLYRMAPVGGMGSI